MGRYVLRRIAQTVPTLLGVMILTFVLFRLLPTDFASSSVGGGISSETVQEVREAYGLNKPLFFNSDAFQENGIEGLFDSQFFEHMGRLARFDFGRSWHTNRRVSEILAEGAGPSLKLMLPIYFGMVSVSLFLGLVSAVRRGFLADKAIMIFCIVMVNIPMMLVVVILQYVFAYKLRLFPVYGFGGLFYLVLPVAIGIVAGLGENVLLVRTAILEETPKFYVKFALSKGLSEGDVLRNHMLRNACIPILSRLLPALPFLFMGSLLLERFFGIPGLGYLTIDAIQHRDYVVVNAVTFLSTLLYCVWNIVIDVSYAWVDPRVTLR